MGGRRRRECDPDDGELPVPCGTGVRGRAAGAGGRIGLRPGTGWRRPLAAVGASALFAWTALGEWELPDARAQTVDYYNYLVSGFQKGSLALDIEVADALKASKNPYDPAMRRPGSAPHDVSYYKGRLLSVLRRRARRHRFFGRFGLLTGCDLSMACAAVIYGLGAFWLGAWLWLRVVRDHFPRASLATKLGGLLATGLAGGQLALVRRTSFWEIPIAAGYFHMVCLRRPRTWRSGPGVPGHGSRLRASRWASRWAAARRSQPRAAGWPASSRPSGGGNALRGARRRAVAPLDSPPCLPRGSRSPPWSQAYLVQRGPLRQSVRVRAQLPADRERRRDEGAPFQPLVRAVQSGGLFLGGSAVGKVLSICSPHPRHLALPARILRVGIRLRGARRLPGDLALRAFPRWLVRRNPGGPAAFGCFVLLVALGTTGYCFSASTRPPAATSPISCRGGYGLACWVGRAREGTAGAGAAQDGRSTGSRLWRMRGVLMRGGLLSERGHPWDPQVREPGRLQPGFHAGSTSPRRSGKGTRASAWGRLRWTSCFPSRLAGSYAPLVVTGVEFQADYVCVFSKSPRLVQLAYAASGSPPVFSGDISIEPGRAYHLRIEDGIALPARGPPRLRRLEAVRSAGR